MAIIKNRRARTSYGTNSKVRRGDGWGGKRSIHSSIGSPSSRRHRRRDFYAAKSNVTGRDNGLPHQGERECLRRRRALGLGA
jgi:hypothetical protein